MRHVPWTCVEKQVCVAQEEGQVVATVRNARSGLPMCTQSPSRLCFLQAA